MKKLTLLILITLLTNLKINAEEKIASWNCSFFDKTYDIQCTDPKENNDFTIYIQVSAKEEYTKAYLSFKKKDIPELIVFLQNIKNKYIEWSNTAKENNILNINKEMNYKTPSCTVCWYGSKWWFSFSHKLIPTFMILKDGTSIISMAKKVTASSNKYIDEHIYFVFSNTEEIDDLIEKLNIDNILDYFNKKNSKEDLFQ